MELFYIILLIFFGLLFLVAELVLLPGVTVGAALALLCDGCAIWLGVPGFRNGRRSRGDRSPCFCCRFW